MKNVYIDTYGDILDEVLNIPKDDRIDSVLKGMIEEADGNGVNVSSEPINSAKDEIKKKKSSKKSSKKKEEKIKHIKIRRIK